MSKKGRELRQFLEVCLAEEGITAYVFGYTGKCHQEVRFAHCGHELRVVFSGSPSDRRSFENSRTTLRRVIRSAAGSALPAAPQARPVLDARGVLPRQPHHVGGRGARPHRHSQAVA